MSGGESLFSSSAGVMAAVALLLALVALAAAVYLLARQQRLLGQYQHLMAGTSGGNLEAALHDHVEKVRSVSSRLESVDDLARRLEHEATFSLRHFAIVRYNPFHATGGDQSFAIALSDLHGNGLVLSSLHSRETTRVYAKPLQAWASTYSLTEEEEQAIALAQRQRA